MGSSHSSSSSSSDPRFNSACRAFTQKELEDLKSLFTSIADQSQTNSDFITPAVFKTYIGIDGPLGDRMFDLVTQKRKDQKLTFQDLIIAKGTYEKGTKDDIEEFIYQLVDVSDDGVVGRSDLESVVNTMLNYVFSQNRSEPELDSHQEIAKVLLNAANFNKHDEGQIETSISFEDFRKWCTILPSVRKFLGSLMSPSDPGSQVPRLHLDCIDSGLVLLRKEYAWMIGGALSQHELEDWKLLYHSAVHGQSFNTFLGKILNDEGPTILVIKDKEGYIYGGYASQPWERHGDFYGDLKSFVFQMYPKAAIFRPTGANHNIQWCAVNFSSESIPNGIGFGGRVNHFGLFVSANFDRGHTFECTTFGSPCLAKSNQICPEVIECWGILTKEAQQERAEATAVSGTVLERFKEDRHMLNMIGLANSSE